MRIRLPDFQNEIYSLKMTYGLNDEVIEIPAEKIDNEWQVIPPQVMEWYFYVIDNRFIVCDSYTNTFFSIKSVFATKTIKQVEPLITIKTETCRSVDLSGRALSKTKVFSKLDPLVILSIELKTELKTVTIITEWIINNKTYWISSKPCKVSNGKINTFNALSLDEDTPTGNGICNVYIFNDLIEQVKFVIIPIPRKNALTPSPAMFNEFI